MGTVLMMYHMLMRRRGGGGPVHEDESSWALLFFGGLAVIAAIILLALVLTGIGAEECVNWLSWKQDNTYPGCRSFEIKEEGEYDWFGSIKGEYDLKVMPGEYVCVRVDADNDYGWMVMVYYGARADPGDDRTENKNHKPSTMFQFGSAFWLIRNGETRCSKVLPMYRLGEKVPGPFVVFKVHWAGFGRGGVTATPVITIEQEDISDEYP